MVIKVEMLFDVDDDYLPDTTNRAEMLLNEIQAQLEDDNFYHKIIFAESYETNHESKM